MKKITFGIIGAVLALSAGLSGCSEDPPPPAAKPAPKAKAKPATPARPAARAATTNKENADAVKGAAPALAAGTARDTKPEAKKADASPAAAASSTAASTTSDTNDDDETSSTSSSSGGYGGSYGGGYGGSYGSAYGGRVTTPTAPTTGTEAAAGTKAALLAKSKSYSTHRLVSGLTFTTRGGQQQSFDAYLPVDFADADSGPFVFLVHGGDWTDGAKEDMKPYGIALAQKGIVAIAPNYRLAPANPHPAQINDLADVMEYIDGTPNVLFTTGSRYGAVGVGAGGHLASLVAFSPSASGRLACVSNVFAQTDLTNLTPLDEQIKQFLGTGYSPEKLMEVSPVYSIGKGSGAPSFFLSHGTNDAKVPYAQSEAFAAELQRNGMSVKLSPVKDGGHGYSEAQTKTTATEIAGFMATCLATL